MALAVEMKNLQERVSSKREKINAYKADIEAFVSNTSMSKYVKRPPGGRQLKKDETAGKRLLKMNLCLNCGKSGHQWKECTESKAVCGSCGRHHHTTMHKTVLEIIARRENRLPFNRRNQKNNAEDQAANVLDIDYSDDSVMDELEESYNSMIQEEYEHAYTGDLDDDLDIEDLAQAMNRI
jgi:hypothetical protein